MRTVKFWNNFGVWGNILVSDSKQQETQDLNVTRTEHQCWECANCAKCAWSKGKPVKGWVAIPTIIENVRNRAIHSYKVLYCPEKVQMDVKSLKEKAEKYARENKCSIRTAYRYLDKIEDGV